MPTLGVDPEQSPTSCQDLVGEAGKRGRPKVPTLGLRKII